MVAHPGMGHPAPQGAAARGAALAEGGHRVDPAPVPVPPFAGDASSLHRVRSDIRAMAGYTPGEQRSGAVKLNTNECPWPPAPGVLDALRALADPGAADRLRLYPDPQAEGLRRAAAERYGVPATAILAGNGSDDCLTIVYRAFLRPGDRVTAPWPTYGLYDTLAALQGVQMVHVDYVRNGRQWHLPEALPQQNARVVLVANPNNPSATASPVSDLRRLCERTDGIVVVDEAYIDFALVEDADASILPHLAAHPNLIVLRTFSKSYSLAGARLGLLFAAPAVITELMKVKDSYNVNHLTQALGIAALADRHHHADAMRRTVAERHRLERMLRERFGWTGTSSAANFLLVQVGPQAERLVHGLRDRGMLVRWWDRPILRECLRITVGRPEDTDRLCDLVAELAP
jgi:histidinol-phosphate aminotransferase